MAGHTSSIVVSGSMEDTGELSSSSSEESDQELSEESEDEAIEFGDDKFSAIQKVPIVKPPPPPTMNTAEKISSTMFGIHYVPFSNTPTTPALPVSEEERELEAEFESIVNNQNVDANCSVDMNEFDFAGALECSDHSSSVTIVDVERSFDIRSSNELSALDEARENGVIALSDMIASQQSRARSQDTSQDLNIGELDLICEVDQEEDDSQEVCEVDQEEDDSQEVAEDQDQIPVHSEHFPTRTPESVSPLTFNRLWDNLKSTQFTEEQRETVVTTEGFFTGSLLGPRLKTKTAKEERDLIFLVAQVHWNPEDHLHLAALQSCYFALRGQPFDDHACGAVGGHWELIGFQGEDPRTDLNRSMGMFAVLQVLHLVETHREASQQLIKALDEADQFHSNTFFCVSLGYSLACITALRRGAVYAQCDRTGQVLTVVNALHHEQCFELHRRLCGAGGEIWDHINSINSELRDNQAVKLYLDRYFASN